MSFPFHVPLYVPVQLWYGVQKSLSAMRAIPPRRMDSDQAIHDGINSKFVRKSFPMNSVTAPLVADLFLLAILAIGRDEVKAGTLGDNGIFPLNIMVFFINLAYIAISIDASGLIRYLTLKVLQWGGKFGHRLFFYLYAFFFGLGVFIGNDSVILSGTAFLAYMTRVSNNIKHPQAWIFTQFSIANIASAVFVSSNPTNLVLAGAFSIKFINYTANMVVPVVATAIVLFPFLLYILFANEGLIPVSIKIRELSTEHREKPAVNPNIPNARGIADDDADAHANDAQGQLLSLVEIMNPFLDKGGAAFGAIIMSLTLVTIVVVNAVSFKTKDDEDFQVFWVTLPAAFVMLCWDLAFGWIHREETREIFRRGREQVKQARMEREARERRNRDEVGEGNLFNEGGTEMLLMTRTSSGEAWSQAQVLKNAHIDACPDHDGTPAIHGTGLTPMLTLTPAGPAGEDSITQTDDSSPSLQSPKSPAAGIAADGPSSDGLSISEKRDGWRGAKESSSSAKDVLTSDVNTTANESQSVGLEENIVANPRKHNPPTLVSLCKDGYRWSQETFPTAMAVISHLPFALVPFVLSMFILVQALVTKGWVSVFAYGWDHWVDKTGTIGAIGGMGFLSVILCNVSIPETARRCFACAYSGAFLVRGN